MMSHPGTPADESDLRLHIARQTSLRIGSAHWTDLCSRPSAPNESDDAAVVCDAFTNEHLDRIAAAVLADARRPRFVVGSGGLSGALGRFLDVEDRVPLPAGVTAAVVESGGDASRLAEVADAWLRQNPKTRLVICGGDTSGAVLRRLGVETLEIACQGWGNVALCSASGPAAYLRDVDVVVKGDQMGHLELFDDVKHGRCIDAH